MSSNKTNLRQGGVALITVMVILLLSIIAVLAAGRAGLLNEALVGNDSDYGRTLAAAEALLRDAETDIRGRTELGYLCHPEVANGILSNTPAANFTGCRDTSLPTSSWFPSPGADFAAMQTLVNATPGIPCVQGICIPVNLNQLANFENAPAAAAINLATMAPLGVRYGTYTRRVGMDGAPISGLTLDINSILRNTVLPLVTTPQQGWYWVEIFPFASTFGGVPNPATPHPSSPFIYRITAIALGQKTGSRAVLRSWYVPNPISQNK